MGAVLRQVLQRAALRRTVRIAAIVGTLASVVNQGSVIAGGGATVSTWIRVAANYVLPFCVSSIGYVAALRTADEVSTPTRTA